MARIRRFVVSQVEGNGANENNQNEIRPYGEIGLFEGQYIDSLQNDRLELLIFDGTRTHLRSKVLSPGRFYGYDADSGDGAGFDTIKLIPDAALFDQNSDQYLIIDPTYGEPGHIHIRAGGNIDQSGADLFLGGELTNVRVSDLGDTVTIRTSQVGDGVINRDWVFDNNGNLTFPGSSSVIGESEPGLVVYSDNGFAVLTDANGDSKSWIFGSDGNLTTSGGLVIGSIPGAGTIMVQDDTPLAVISANANGYAIAGWGESANSPGNIATISFNSPAVSGGAANVSITTGNNDPGGTQYDWVFGNDGVLTFPDATVQSTAYSPQPVPASPQGKAGDKLGMVAGDSSYFYYCVAAYDGSTIIWHRVANDGNNAWSNP